MDFVGAGSMPPPPAVPPAPEAESGGKGKRGRLFGGGGKHAKNKRDPLRSFKGGGKKGKR